MSAKQERVIGVIPARWASTRLPGKALAPICGKPLIQWVLERTRQATRLDEVLVATDDERIRSVVEGLGGVAVMTRADHPSGTDRVAEAVAGREAGVGINIQGDAPLLDPGLINRLAAVMLAVRPRRWMLKATSRVSVVGARRAPVADAGRDCGVLIEFYGGGRNKTSHPDCSGWPGS